MGCGSFASTTIPPMYAQLWLLTAHVQRPKFSRDQQVWLNVSSTTEGRGPYIIERVIKDKLKYTLCMSDGRRFRNGEVFAESDLTLVT